MKKPATSTIRINLIRINRQICIDLIAYSFILLFIYAATSKLSDYENSELQLSKSPMIKDFAHILVWLVPGIEIIISFLLMWQRTIQTGLYASFVLMVLFTAYIIAILNFSNFIPCSCGGVLSTLSWKGHLVLNIIFIALAAAGVLLKPLKVKE